MIRSLKLFFLLLPALVLFACNDPGTSTAETGTTPEISDSSSTYNPLLRHTVYGDIEGVGAASDTWSWLGIPFAKPPVGTLRWKAPRDPEAWEGVKKADSFCNYCVQYGNIMSETGADSLDNRIVGSEDCLYMNLWRPATAEKKLPVFVFIHGGGNLNGRSDLSFYDGANFAAKNNMIFVSINYRLGYFGWFTHPALREGKDALDDSGNYGTLDQIKALKWIQANIEEFGGDPGNVTISGQSAGGMNVFAMMTSPLAKGLFHRAVIMSSFNQSATMTSADIKGEAAFVRMLVQDREPLVYALIKDNTWKRNFLRSRKVNDVYGPTLGNGICADSLLTPLAIMGIYIDGKVIPMSPIEAFATGRYNKVPVILGCTKDEFRMFLPVALIKPGDLNSLIIKYDPNNPNINITDYISPLYLPLFGIYDKVIDLGKLAFQGYGVETMARLLSSNQDDVYSYKFCWDEQPKPFDYLVGASHTMDIPFAFGNFIEDKSSVLSFCWSDKNREGREALSDAMMSYFGSFARTGNPNVEGSNLPQWKPWSNTPNTDKRIIFDSDDIYMSKEIIEPGEIPNASDMIKELFELIINPLSAA